jgi:hypothetical protein
MAQGMRGRVALVGAGVLFCSGLMGCMSDDKPLGTPPLSKSMTQAKLNQNKSTMSPTAGGYPTSGTGYPSGNTGFQQTGFSQTNGARSTPGYDSFGTGRNPGTMGTGMPAVTGITGPGGPMPGMSSNSVVPPVTPPGYPTSGSNYSPTSSQQSAGYPNSPASPVSPAGGYASETAVHGASNFNPPEPTLSDLQPPGAPASHTPSVSPAGGPLPPSPPPGASTYPPAGYSYPK